MSRGRSVTSRWSRPAGPLAAGDRWALPGVVLAAAGLVLAGIGGVDAGAGPGLAAVAAAVLLLAWTLAPPVAVATLGAFLLVAVGGGHAASGLVGAGLAAILLGPLVETAIGRDLAVTTVASVLAVTVPLVLGTILALRVASIPGAAATLLVVVALASYAVHRYQLVATGGVDPEVGGGG